MGVPDDVQPPEAGMPARQPAGCDPEAGQGGRPLAGEEQVGAFQQDMEPQQAGAALQIDGFDSHAAVHLPVPGPAEQGHRISRRGQDFHRRGSGRDET
jgi:hypothetical protein